MLSRLSYLALVVIVAACSGPSEPSEPALYAEFQAARIFACPDDAESSRDCRDEVEFTDTLETGRFYVVEIFFAGATFLQVALYWQEEHFQCPDDQCVVAGQFGPYRPAQESSSETLVFHFANPRVHELLMVLTDERFQPLADTSFVIVAEGGEPPVPMKPVMQREFGRVIAN